MAIVFGFLMGANDGLQGFGHGCCDANGLYEQGVDLFEINGLGAVAHGFDECSETGVSHGSKDAILGPRTPRRMSAW